jgi:hypothetical protein
MAAVVMAAALAAEAFMAKVFMAEAFTIGPFPACGDFGVPDLDMMVSSAIPTQTPQPTRLLFLRTHRPRPLSWR